MTSKVFILKYPVKELLQLVILFLLLSTLNAKLLLAETINSIVATVESQSITDYDLKKSPLKKSPNLLDQEIFAKLIKLDAKRHGITTNTEEINYYLGQVAYNQGLTTAELLQQQKAKGLSAEAVRSEMELEILKQKLAMKLFQNSKSVLGEKKSGSDISKVNLSQIVIDLSKHDLAEAEERVKKIEEGFENGQTFELLVEEYSDAIDKTEKGLLGELNWKDLDPNFRIELEKISPSEITAPIKKGTFLFIFKLNQVTTFEEIDETEVEQELSPAEINSLLKEYFSKDLYKNYLIDKK